MQTNRWLCLVVVLLSSAALAAAPLTTQEVEEALTCQCGCGLTVHSCNHLQCGFAIPAKQEVAQAMSEGKGRDEILSSFVARYGEKVLSAPTTSGFNLAAWITPFLAVLAGAVLVGLVSFRWARRRSHNESEPRAQPEITDHYRTRLQRELDSFDG